MATVPLSGSDIRFLSGVPFQNDYKHTRWFDTKSQQTAYFNSKIQVHTMERANFVRIEGSHRVAVNEMIDNLWEVNYMMFRNSAYSDKWFYAFVTKLEYENKHTTWAHFEIDVFQTWCFDMKFKPSFVVREHRPLRDSDGNPVINTLDEGLNYGDAYDNMRIRQWRPNDGMKWLVIVSKEPMHSDSEDGVTPTVIGTPQPLSYYITPFRDNNKTPVVILPSGLDVPITPPTELLQELYKDEKAVNNIVSLYVTEYTGLPTTYQAPQDGGAERIVFPDNGNKIASVLVGEHMRTLYVQQVTQFENLNYEMTGNKYAGFLDKTESKQMMYPYCVLVMDDFKGNRVEYRPEYIETDKIKITCKGSLGTSNKVSYSLADYNYKADDLKGTLSNEFALINNNPSDVPIINDMLAAFLQGNRNSLENQRSSILFNGVMGGISSTIGGIASASSGNMIGLASSSANIVQGAGNTVLQLQSIEAKQKDISNTPPQIAKMGANTSYDSGNGYNGVYVIWKQIKPEYRRKLDDFFNMYGYKTNEVKTPNFHTRKYWNFVQTASCMITGNFNNEDLNDLKAVFDNGITFWHTDDVGNYSLENVVI